MSRLNLAAPTVSELFGVHLSICLVHSHRVSTHITVRGTSQNGRDELLSQILPGNRILLLVACCEQLFEERIAGRPTGSARWIMLTSDAVTLNNFFD